MSRYDRYVLSQYLLFFGFFALILVAIFWINRAVSLFDWLIGGGQTIGAFVEFSALALPNMVRMVLPIAAFAATAWVTNRLSNESELTVLRATGSSPWQLARPALVFGVFGAVMMAALTHVLLPASRAEMSRREAEVASSLGARLLSPGTFLHPVDGVTVFIRSIDDDGTFHDVFLNDQRAASGQVTYTSESAYLLQDGDTAHLILVDGMAQKLNAAKDLLSTTTFSDLSYNIGSFKQASRDGPRPLRVIPTRDLLFHRQDVSARDGHSIGQQVEELHERIARSTATLAVVMVAFSTLMLGSFSRFGVWRQVLGAFVILIVIEGMRGAVADVVRSAPSLWLIMYLPSLFGCAVSVMFLHLATHPPRPRWRNRSAQ